jgi:sugar phosphate isomerase/epimerase
MKLGAFNIMFFDQSLEEALKKIKEYGCDAVEIGSGGFTPKKHLNAGELIEDEGRCRQLVKTVEKNGLFISALSCHANMLHPNREFSERHHKDFREVVTLAGKIGVERVVTFAGCPGSSDRDAHPNWITCPWPEYFTEALKWQWEKKIIPFWKEEVQFARKNGVKMICLEMHPGDAVYTPEKLLNLREAAGEEIGCNFDPSHLFWQGIDPVAAVRKLRECIFHVHAKDSRVEPVVVRVNGVLDNKPYSDEYNRSWLFRTVGYGNDYGFWKDFVSTLRLTGYDHVLSIEHEDSLMSSEEGLEKAVAFLKEVMITRPRGALWWD